MIALQARFGRLRIQVDRAERERSGLLLAAGCGIRALEVETLTRLAADAFLEMAAPLQVSNHGYRQNLRVLYGWPGAVVEVGGIYRDRYCDGWFSPEDPARVSHPSPLDAGRVSVLRFIAALRALPRS